MPNKILVTGAMGHISSSASFLPVTTDGHKSPPDRPGWGAEWDEEKFDEMIVAEH